MKKLVVGLGYLGGRMALRWLDAGDEVWGTSRSPEKRDAWSRRGLRMVPWEAGCPDSEQGILDFPGPPFDTALYCVGFDRRAVPDEAELRDQAQRGGLRRLRSACEMPPRNLIYISSTGVYGTNPLAESIEVNESSPCAPDTPSGRAILDAEQFVRSYPIAESNWILRLAGLYGPQRVPRIGALDDHGWLNLIHVEDAMAAIGCVETSGGSPSTYCVSDGKPVRRSAFHAEAMRLGLVTGDRLTGAREIRQELPNLPNSRRRSGNKRVDSSRIRAELGFRCRYGDFKQGLAAIAAEARPFPSGR